MNNDKMQQLVETVIARLKGELDHHNVTDVDDINDNTVIKVLVRLHSGIADMAELS